ncbi:hypothetical protein BKH43_06850 [Helicobacter sp. 13S00401-1]|uniref:single-stranded-DNA-specific exonuclease RecJ n=1 Tax=Helicobacter sp. 13S00401-1 TaxID=1905758 RepID=UPI000BA581A9|nr:DHH family phosphoesterase [Helicobacter sp. 13S00401-1]PAF49361.1 hypothetical protein BKH43_06850 [Helicobacter sp. 13S00401-1]
MDNNIKPSKTSLNNETFLNKNSHHQPTFLDEAPTFKHINDLKKILDSRVESFEIDHISKIPNHHEMKNVKEASKLVAEYIRDDKHIMIAGDYDADGICASAIMLDFFKYIGYKNVSFSIPNRFKHGYGFSEALFLEELEKNPDIALIITVDNGVSSFEAGELCASKNIRFIITDHHTLHQDEDGNELIPPCDFLINPKQAACHFPYEEVCGSLVAWYFTRGIASSLDIKLEAWQRSSLVFLVGVSIISDVMPLHALNHTICNYAIKSFHHQKRPCLETFKKGFYISKADSTMFGFKLAPLLNSAGRMDDGKVALKFLLASDEKEAYYYFKILKDLNQKRKILQEEVFQEACETMVETSNLIMAVGKDWHEGVIGIVAGRLADKYKKPAFVLTKSKIEDYKGSGRSFENVDLIASVQKLSHLLNRFGGHTGAVGLALKFENIQPFIDGFEPIYFENKPELSITGKISHTLINMNTLRLLDKYEPYGNSNAMPIFYAELYVKSFILKNKFIEFVLYKGDIEFKAMMFGVEQKPKELEVGDILRFSFTLNQDSFNENKVVLFINKLF